MPPIRTYVMRPLGSAGPWHVSVNGSEGESFKDEESAVRAALDLARRLGQEPEAVEMGQGLALSVALQVGCFQVRKGKTARHCFPLQCPETPVAQRCSQFFGHVQQAGAVTDVWMAAHRSELKSQYLCRRRQRPQFQRARAGSQEMGT